MEVRWKDIKGYPGYKVSDHGDVYSKRLKGNLRAFELKAGCLGVALYNQTNMEQRAIHYLVAEAFCPNPEGHKDVRFIDSDKMNLHYLNLEWWSRADRDATITGKAITLMNRSGEKFHSNSISKFAREHKLDRSQVSMLVNGRIDSYKGWARVE